jgi:hypothetical protein
MFQENKMPSLLDRLTSKYVVDAESGCWVWTGAFSNKRNKWLYGLILVEKKLRMAHRVMYEMKVGKIPEGLQLDHLCRNTKCINPAHLEPVTAKENIARSINFQSSKTQCINGHELAGPNLYVKPNGSRECRICRKVQWKMYKARKEHHLGLGS